MNIQQFEVHVPDTLLHDLEERLALTRWPDEIPDSGWTYGTNLGYLKELIDYWQHKFKWREQEAKLNKFDQFKTLVDGVKNEPQKALAEGMILCLVVFFLKKYFLQFLV